MNKTYPIPEWLPDQPDGLVIAENVFPIADGYVPAQGPQAVTTAAPAPIVGAGVFIDSTGASTLLAGTAANIYQYSGSAWGVTLTVASAKPLRFAQFGDNVLYANGGIVGSYALLTAIGSNPTNAPNAVDIAQVRDFVMAITTDNAVQWCQFDNSADWTIGTNQADKQPSLWGQLRRIVGGEYGILFTEKAVIRATYVGIEGGLDIVWQFDQISQEVGCMAAGSVCNVGRLVFFLSERGFEMCDGQEVTPIADEKFNRWFFDKFSRADIANITAAVDPRNSRVLWAMPGSPGTVVAYNWVLKKASTLSLNVEGLFSGYTAGATLDGLGNIDTLGISLDDPSLQGGSPLLLVADTSNVLNALTGDNLAATMKLVGLEPSPGVRSRIRSIRLVTDAVEGSVTNDARMRQGDGESIRTASSMRLNGKFPIRSNGRYNDLTFTIPAGAAWTYAQACELEFERGDGR